MWPPIIAIIDPVLPQLRAALAGLAPPAPTIPIITTTYGGRARAGRVLDADYWAANLRNPVRFTQAMAAAGADHARFIEVSPHPLLTHAITETLTDHHHHASPPCNATPTTPHLSHQPQHRPHHPPPTHRPSTRTPPDNPDHPLAAHPPLDQPTHPTAAGSVATPGTLLGEHITVSSTPPAHLWQSAAACRGPSRIRAATGSTASKWSQSPSCSRPSLAQQPNSGPPRCRIRFDHPVVLDRPQFIQVVADHEYHPGFEYGC